MQKTTTQHRPSPTSTIIRPAPPLSQDQIPSQPATDGAALLPPSLEDPSRAFGIVRARAIPSRSNQSESESVLQHESVYPIQIGSELFRLSGASLTSDAPSYFTRFFEEQIRENGGEEGGGYHIQPLDGSHYVRLFADAQFYGLPRLVSQLFSSSTYIQIGDRHFQIPRDSFSSPGDSPNYFTLGFAAFFATPGQVFPGLDRTGLLRPPSIQPPSVPSRSAHVFEQLLHALRGYPLRIKDEEHRAELLRDCRYFHLRGLEQRLVRCEIGFDAKRDVEEITIGLEDVKTTGLSIVERNNLPVQEPDVPAIVSRRGWVHYKRPFVDEQARELIIEIGGEKDPTMLDLDEGKAAFRGRSQAKVDALLKAVAKKVDPDVTLTLPGDGSLTFSINETTDLNLDGKSASLEAWDNMADETAARRGKKRKLDDTVEREPVQWEVRTGQWKLLLHRPLDSCNMAIVLVAMKIDAFSCEKARNARRRFLS